MRKCERNSPLDTKVSGKEWGGGALDTMVEILLQHMEVPATPGYVLKKAAAWGNPHRDRCLTKAAAHGGEHLLSQACYQD